MVKTIEAKSEVILLGHSDLTIFLLPNGSYVLDLTRVCSVINEQSDRLSNVSKTVRGRVLEQSGFNDHEEILSIDGQDIRPVPLDIAYIFWCLESAIGNRLALPLVCNCGLKTLEQRADSAFSDLRIPN